MTPIPARVIYPELPDPLTPGDLQQLFNPSFDERQWAPTVARTVESQVALLVQLKIFQTIGRFQRGTDIPSSVIEHVARRMGMESASELTFADRTLYRHRPAILKHLKVFSWGPEARALAQTTMRRAAQARTDPADIINAAIDALIRHGYELPTNWLRVFRIPESVAKPHEHWVLGKRVICGKIRRLWQAKWRRVSIGNGFQRV